jgi:ribosomal protein S18 acetylase RimI-like enzyme
MKVRAAQKGDKPGVKALCARIWSDDYVPEVFDQWVRDRRGRLWVAVEGDRVVGVAKLTVAPSHEAWLHGLRVHPDYRRRGIATALLAHRLARARQLGARVARLDTADDNVAVRRLVRRSGFRQIARIAGYVARPLAGGRPRRATARELPSLWGLVRSARAMLHEAHFARRIARDDIAHAIRARGCFVAGAPGRPSAVALIEDGSTGHHRGSRLVVTVVAGAPRAMRDLLRALRAEAGARGFAHASIAAPDALWPGVRSAGYRRRWPETMLIFERRL